MITKTRHFGILILNETLDSTINFYEELGLKIIYRQKEIWEDYLGECDIVKLETPDKKVFEIIGNNNLISRNSHICFEVENIDIVYKHLLQKNITFIVHPKQKDNIKIAFCYDPNYFIIELVECMK